MKNILKKIWSLYCMALSNFVHDWLNYSDAQYPSVFKWCFKGFLFNMCLLGVIFAMMCLAYYWLYISFCCWPLITSCFVGAVFLFGIVLPLLVRRFE